MKAKKTDLVLGFTGVGRADGDNIHPFNRLFKHAQSLTVKGAFDMVDAVVLWGGTDVHPSMYNQKRHPSSQVPLASKHASARDTVEWHVMRECYSRRIPIIGVCRGAQILCVFAGGSLYQDVNNHGGSHSIETYDKRIFEAPAGHHQMMNLDGTKYELLGWPYRWQSGMTGPERALATRYEREEMVSEPGVHLTNDEGKEPEIVYFPQVRGFAIQPHPEWVGGGFSGFIDWLMPEIEKRL